VIDFHAHLDLYPHPAEVVSDCVSRNMYVLSVTTTPSAWCATRALANQAPRIRTALGLHPEIAHERKGELGLFDDLLPKTRYVGEIGLDGSPHLRAFHTDQRAVFHHLLSSCARAGGRIMTLHSRRAVEPVLDALEMEPNAGTAVLHWFSGTARQLRRAIALGCWFSVGPTMLAGERGRTLVALMPKERVLTESDGPFASLANARLWPRDVVAAVGQLSILWGEPVDCTTARLMRNLALLTGQWRDYERKRG
jgi:TatD DNase family protein